MSSRGQKLTDREQRVEDWFELPMMLVTALLVVTLMIPIIMSLPAVWVRVFATINFVIWFAFYIELFAKLYVAKSKLDALKRNWWLAVIAIAPLFLPLRLMRLSRLIGLVRFLRLQKAVSKMRSSLRELIYNIEYILITFTIFIFCSAFIMWQIEAHFDGSIISLADALWWSVITITTIGYGDVIPTSAEGKVVGAIVSLLGTILFMVFVARVTTLFVHDKDIDTLKRMIKNKK
ncbi:potassium channel family protein [Candidatus Kaiserbacteria bacterium]|nr:potassium channel family protein [Candidatus Kaiserbacteria bacterium]MCB9818078.1 potassium channel family protein [Candidatus Nomurabacteria bacterium]